MLPCSQKTSLKAGTSDKRFSCKRQLSLVATGDRLHSQHLLLLCIMP